MRIYELTGFLAEVFLKQAAKWPTPSFVQSSNLQRKTLLSLVAKAQNTQFGQDHEFAQIGSVDDFQHRVPIRDYTKFWTTYWQPTFPNLDNISWPGRIPYFAKTSGTTTGKSKFLPCSFERVKSDNKAGVQVLLEHFRNKPESTALRGRYFMFGGSPKLEQLAPGVLAGELSGIAANETPKWAGRDRYYPPERLAQLEDWTTKIDTLSADSLTQNIRAISGLPSWLKLLFTKMFEDHPAKPQRLKAFFPSLQLIVHGGMSFDPYRAFFEEISENDHTDFREIYAASEGFFGISDGAYGEGMRLIVDNDIFYEFVRLEDYHLPNPERFWLENIEDNVDYALIVTTCAGLWSYVVGDIIRFVDKSRLRFLFSGRLSQTLSMFGEKVLNQEVETAVASATTALGLAPNDFSLFSAFTQDDDSLGRYTFYVELAPMSDAATALAGEIDTTLKSLNSGYAARRLNDVSMVAPQVVFLRQGGFEAWMNAKGKAGGQHKVPRVISPEQAGELDGYRIHS